MSTVTQLSAELIALQREVRTHQDLIGEYLRKNQDNMHLVVRELEGSSTHIDVTMMNSITQVEDRLKRAQSELRMASEALSRVQARI